MFILKARLLVEAKEAAKSWHEPLAQDGIVEGYSSH